VAQHAAVCDENGAKRGNPPMRACGLEAGAIKSWGETGEKTFDADKPRGDRVLRLGGKVYAQRRCPRR
jgi:hypothetical protein